MDLTETTQRIRRTPGRFMGDSTDMNAHDPASTPIREGRVRRAARSPGGDGSDGSIFFPGVLLEE
jgi:hypothetical protein